MSTLVETSNSNATNQSNKARVQRLEGQLRRMRNKIIELEADLSRDRVALVDHEARIDALGNP